MAGSVGVGGTAADDGQNDQAGRPRCTMRLLGRDLIRDPADDAGAG